MKAYWVKPIYFKKLFSGYVWDIPNTEKRFTWLWWRPYPEITDGIAVTKKHGATASFFSIGNIEENPEI
jgi:hypothetical protein